MAKAKTYVYRLVSKYRKHPELLLDYGFNFYTDEKNEEKIFAFPVVLKEENPLFIQCVRFLEHCYGEATTEERKTDFKDFEFKKELNSKQQWVDRLVLNDKIREEFSQAQLCVSINKMEQDSSYLFINSPIQNSYYNYETIKDCAPELVEKLLKDKVIYARRYLYNSR